MRTSKVHWCSMTISNVELHFIVGMLSCKIFTSCMDSLLIKFQSSTLTLKSFSHNWNIRFIMAEYPPLSLLILGSYNLWNSHATIFISYPGGYIVVFMVFTLALPCWGTKVLFSLILDGGFRCVDVRPPSDYWQSTHGRDDVSPTWLPQPIHLQKRSFPWSE